MGKWQGIVGRSFTPEEFREYVAGLNWDDWGPEFIVLHNTEDPSLAKLPHGYTYQDILDLEKYYRDDCKWSAGPHLVVDDHQIWVFSALREPGVHANSWNSRTIGVEMLGDYRHEAFNSGRGLEVQKNAVTAVAILTRTLGLDPDTMMLHRENGATKHYCPGDNVDKADFILQVKTFLAGESLAARIDQTEPPLDPGEDAPQGACTITYRVKAGNLNIRSGPGTNYEAAGTISAGEIVTPVETSGWVPIPLNDGSVGWLSREYLEPMVATEPEAGSAPVESSEDSAPPRGPGRMKVSQHGLEFIKNEEGCVLHVYKDQAGYPTIGVGHLIKPGEEFATLSESEALDLLAKDLKVAEDAVQGNVLVPLSQNQFDALVSFTFNVGTGALEKSTLLKLLNQGQYEAVPGELMRWIKAGSQTLPGLVNRRQHEGELWGS
ncbi:MAG: glycoside hydrolase family protein [Desulfobaccales bacterium]